MVMIFSTRSPESSGSPEDAKKGIRPSRASRTRRILAHPARPPLARLGACGSFGRSSTWGLVATMSGHHRARDARYAAAAQRDGELG